MYGFLTHLVETPESIQARQYMREAGVEEERQVRLFNHLTINSKLGLSVQAAYATCCEPSLTLENLSEYESMEVALIKGKSFVTVDKVLPNFSRLAELELLNNRSIYEHVPLDLIEDLYKELEIAKGTLV